VQLKYEKGVPLALRSHPTINEKWIQELLAGDSELLGLGELELRDKERVQPSAGRLDLVFDEPGTSRRYEVEIQLGPTDESHIIRTIEYWDYERKRSPHLDHVAVLVAEDITSRFLNVISLLNGSMPLVALQMRAIQVGNAMTLVFTRVLDERRIRAAVDSEVPPEPTDMTYWERKKGKGSLDTVVRVFAILRRVAPDAEPRFNKHYVGVARDGVADNFVVIYPKKGWVWVCPKLARTPETDQALEEAEVEVGDYDVPQGRYRLRFRPDNVDAAHDVLVKAFQKTLTQWNE
jgi:hypothetical protein